MSVATRALYVDGITGHSGNRTKIGEAIKPDSGYGAVFWNNGSNIDLSSVYYRTSVANTHLVWIRSITIYLDGGLCGVNIGSYINSRNPLGAVNITLVLASNDVVSDLHFKDFNSSWKVVFINHGTIIGAQSKQAITMYSNGRAVIENRGEIKGGGGHGGKGQSSGETKGNSGWLNYTSTTMKNVISPYSGTYWLDYQIRGGGGSGARRAKAGWESWENHWWKLYGGHRGKYKSGNFGTTGTVRMQVGRGATTPSKASSQPNMTGMCSNCVGHYSLAPVYGAKGGTSQCGPSSARAEGGAGSGWFHCTYTKYWSGTQGYKGRGLSRPIFNSNEFYNGESTGAGSGGAGDAKPGANGYVKYKWHYKIPGRAGGNGGNGATRANCGNVYEVSPTSGASGTSNTGGAKSGKGGSGGSWGASGQYGYTTSGSQSSSLKTGRTSGGASVIGYYSYAKSGSFLGTKNVNYWGNPT